MARSKSSKIDSFKQQVAKAKAFILDAQQTLPIDGDPVLPAEARSLRAVGITPTDALGAVAEILATHGTMFPTFDASGASDAFAYDVAMRDLASTARAFARRIDRSVLRRRAAPVNNAFALYAAAKAVGRVDEQLAEPVRRLGKLLVIGRRRSVKKPIATTQAPATAPGTNAEPATASHQPATPSPQPSAPVANVALNGTGASH
jgi:hypothetical protein